MNNHSANVYAIKKTIGLLVACFAVSTVATAGSYYLLITLGLSLVAANIVGILLFYGVFIGLVIWGIKLGTTHEDGTR
jgi:hypothetical protein